MAAAYPGPGRSCHRRACPFGDRRSHPGRNAAHRCAARRFPFVGPRRRVRGGPRRRRNAAPGDRAPDLPIVDHGRAAPHPRCCGPRSPRHARPPAALHARNGGVARHGRAACRRPAVAGPIPGRFGSTPRRARTVPAGRPTRDPAAGARCPVPCRHAAVCLRCCRRARADRRHGRCARAAHRGGHPDRTGQTRDPYAMARHPNPGRYADGLRLGLRHYRTSARLVPRRVRLMPRRAQTTIDRPMPRPARNQPRARQHRCCGHRADRDPTTTTARGGREIGGRSPVLCPARHARRRPRPELHGDRRHYLLRAVPVPRPGRPCHGASARPGHHLVMHRRRSPTNRCRPVLGSPTSHRRSRHVCRARPPTRHGRRFARFRCPARPWSVHARFPHVAPPRGNQPRADPGHRAELRHACYVADGHRRNHPRYSPGKGTSTQKIAPEDGPPDQRGPDGNRVPTPSE